MRSIHAVLALLALTGTVRSQNVGINSTGAAPAASAMLDINSTSSGVLIPRVALTATNVAAPVTAPATSLMVYNTATVDLGLATDVYPGFYHWDGAQWRRVVDAITDLWYYPPLTINANTRYTLTGTIPGATIFTGASVALSGDWAVTPDVVIEHVESRAGAVRFRVLNRSLVTNYVGMDFIITTIRY